MKHIMLITSMICVTAWGHVTLIARNSTNPYDFGLTKDPWTFPSDGLKKYHMLIRKFSAISKLPSAEQEKIFAKHIAQETYDSRRRKAEKELIRLMQFHTAKPALFGLGAAATAHLIKQLIPAGTAQHAWSKIGILIGGIGAPYVWSRFITKRKTLRKEISQINALFQLDDDHLGPYITEIHTSINLAKAGLPHPFVDSKKRLKIPQDVYNAIVLIQQQELDSNHEVATLFRATLKELIGQRITELRKIYKTLIPLNAFLASTLAANLAAYPSTHVSLTRQQIVNSHQRTINAKDLAIRELSAKLSAQSKPLRTYSR